MEERSPGAGRPSGDLFKPLAKVLYLAIGLVALVWFAHLIRYVLLAALLALILAVALNGPVTWLERRRVSRPAATALSFFAIAGVLAGVGWLVVPRLTEEVAELVSRVPDLVEDLQGRLGALLGDSPEVQRQLSLVFDRGLSLFEGLWRQVDVVLGALALGLFVVALVLYTVVYLRPLLGWYVRSVPPAYRDAATRAFAKASQMVLGWVYATVILGGLKAVAVFLFLSAVGVAAPVVWSVVGFFGAFVPNVGFYLMSIPPVLMILAEDPMLALWTFLFLAAFSEFLGRFVSPWIYAETMRLNAVYVLFMTIAVGYAFGLIGVLIAVPVAGFVKAYYVEFYLARQPEVEGLDERVTAMVERDASWSGEPSKA